MVAALFCARVADAELVITIQQSGSNVVVVGSGTVDLAGVTFIGMGGAAPPQMDPAFGVLFVGSQAATDDYSGLSGPQSFGGGFGDTATGTGDSIGFEANPNDEIRVPVGYVSGAPLFSTATFDNTTLANLGATAGVYTYSWGSGADADSLILFVGVPEPASPLLITLGAAALSLLTWRSLVAQAR